jgi:DNA-binding GntR family transcriptional regulator
MLRIIRNFNDRTHAVRIVDLREPANIRLIAADLFALIDALVGGDAEKAIANLERQVAQKIQRLPELVRVANEDASLAPLP